MITRLANKKGIRLGKLSKLIGTDKFVFARIVKGDALPTVKTAENLCKQLDCFITDIYSKKELDFTGLMPKTARKRNYNFCVDIPEVWADKITTEVLATCGYSSRAQWFIECAKQLLDKYHEIKGV